MPLARHATLAFALLATSTVYAQTPPTTPPATPDSAAAAAAPRQRPPRVVRLGVSTPGVQRPLDSIEKTAIFPVEGSPDWSVVTPTGLWVSSSSANHVVQLLSSSNTVGIIADVPRPCAGIISAFDSIWVPSCAYRARPNAPPPATPPTPPAVVRLDPATGKITATIPADMANSEGGIATGAGSVWVVVKPSTLTRIDPKTNTVTASLELPSESENPTFADGFLWISSYGHDSLLKVDPKAMAVVATIPVGPKPRFLIPGDGSIWTLNQGDGSISRVDMKSGKLVATIQCGIQGSGGDITFGEGFVWAAMFDFPITQVDPKTNTVVKQWAGQGGDGIRAGGGSIWLSNLRQGNVWRFSPNQK